MSRTALALLLASLVASSVSAAELVVYTERKEPLVKPIFDRYQKETGTTVRLLSDGAPVLIERLAAEGANTRADLFMSVDAGSLWQAAERGLLAPIKSPALDAAIPANLRDPQGRWFALSQRARTIVYSTERVKPAELSTYEALADAKWKGRLCLRSSKKVYNQSLVATMIERLGAEKTEQVVRGWVANNPTLIDRMPANMPEVARVMIRRGAPREDLDTGLGLVMTSSQARENDLQIRLVEMLVEAGARPKPEDMNGILGFCETQIVEYLVAAGMPLTAPIAAGLGRLDTLPRLLRVASQKDIDDALDLAVINGHTEAVRLALKAGATVNRRSSQHRHGNPIHQAALVGNTDILDLLAAHGADLTVVDDLWDGVPWGWAIHGGNPAAIAWFEARLGGRSG